MAKATPAPRLQKWRAAFPFEETRKVVGFLVRTWVDLVARNMPRFQPTASEPHLTLFLCEVLQRSKEEAGLTGQFCAEVLRADPNLETGQLTNRRRTDIRYFSDRTIVDLTFEFKKLSATSSSRQAYYGPEGMRRFVDGKYSRDNHVACMVGLIADSRDECLLALKRSISRPRIAADLCMLKDDLGVMIREPSRELPEHAQFDTEHSRLAIGNERDIVLCHLFLDHVTEPKPKKKR